MRLAPFKTGWFGSKLTRDRSESRSDTLGKQSEKTHLSLEVWEPRAGRIELGSCFPWRRLPRWLVPSPLTMLELPCLLPAGPPPTPPFYSKATWWAHVPEGPSTQRFTFSTAHIVWARDHQTRNPGKEKELFCPKGRGTWYLDISPSLGALLASCAALLSAPFGN